MEIDFEKVRQLVKEGYISARKHPTAPLWIYNYTAKTQYEGKWTPETMRCRGLIADEQDQIIARPFEKFFNYEEYGRDALRVTGFNHGQIPVEPFEVYEKIDGSLGVMYWIGDEPFISTRGSFESEMAQRANQMLRGKYAKWIPFLQKHLTYLFEIVYKANRIVVDYGGAEELFLLAVLETDSGTELTIDPVVWQPRAKRFDGIRDLSEIKKFENDKDEGFVIRFESGLRVKIKFEEYKRLHRILTGMSFRRLYEYMGIAAMRGAYTAKQIGRALYMDAGEVEKIAAVEDPLAQVLDKVPDEFYKWVRNTKLAIERQYVVVEDRAIELFRKRPDGDRKAQAEYFGRSGGIPSVLFNMLDGKNYAHDVWRAIRPEHERPFKKDEG